MFERSTPAIRIVQAQFVLTIVVSMVCLMFGWNAALSAFLGSLTCALPSAFMAYRFLREVAETKDAFANLVRGEIGKLLLTGVMFVVVFLTFEQLSLPFFFAALVLGLSLNAFVPISGMLRNSL